MALLAVLVGVIAGLGAVVFRTLIGLFHNLFFAGRLDAGYNALAHTATSVWGPAVIVVPAVGALAVVFLVRRFAPEAKGHGVPEVIDAVHFKRGVIRPQVAAVKALASSISIGSGGAVGREGPIIQIGSTFGSVLAGRLHLAEWQRLTLIAAGGGGGIAATFNTPIGGVLFAAEILLVEISARTLIPVMIATGTASLVGRAFFGNHPSFVIPALTLNQGPLPSVRLVAYVVLGLIVGGLAWLYTRSIYWAEDLFDKLPVNDYVRHTIGMLLVGVTIFVLVRTMGHYYVEGVGYATIQDILDGALTAGGTLLLLALLKLLATALTLGSGASGGVFSPALFTGAAMGGVFASAVNAVVPSMAVNPANAAVVGMACMVGASTGASVTAVVMVFEMTRDYHVIIPLIIAVSIAYWMRRALMADTIYTLKLSRRGQHIPRSIQNQYYLARTALDFIQEPFVIAPARATVGSLPLAVAKRPVHVLLEAEDGSLAGVVGARTVRDARRARAPDAALADLADTGAVRAAPEERVVDLLARLRTRHARVAVLTSGGSLVPARDVQGVLTWEDILEGTNLSDSLDGASGRPS